MEVINDFLGTVYHRVDVDESNKELPESSGIDCFGQAVRWKPKYRIKQFPTALGALTSVPYLFSPNFKY